MYLNEKLDYDKDGFCVLKGFFEQSEVDELIKNIDMFILNELPALSGREVNYIDGELNSIHALHKNDNYMVKLALEKRMLDLAEKFLEAKPELRGVELFAKPAKKGLPSPMHQDNFYWCVNGANALTFWIALDASSAKNGGVAYYPGSHKLGLIEHKNSNAPGSSQKVPDEFIEKEYGSVKPVIPAIQPGDILVHHSLTFHGSGANKSDMSRRGLTMQFKDKSVSYNKEMQNHYDTNLEKQVKARS